MVDPGMIFGDIDPIALAIGGLLLIAGRKLFGLALGVVGFLLGIHVAQRLGLDLSETLRIAVGIALGLVGVVIAFAAKRVATTLAGVLVGGFGALWLAQPWAADLGPWIWALALFGALVGVSVAAMLFEAALVLITSWVGAGLLTQGLDPVAGHRLWIFAGFLVIGIFLQFRRRKSRRRA
jgi:hypothetical protein